MTNFIARLEDWSRAWEKAGTPRPRVKFRLGPTDRPKRSAWLELEDDRIVAQVTVWVSGECEAEADRVADGSVLFRKSCVLQEGEDLNNVIDELLLHFRTEA
jgi:hypothetical protein